MWHDLESVYVHASFVILPISCESAYSPLSLPFILNSYVVNFERGSKWNLRIFSVETYATADQHNSMVWCKTAKQRRVHSKERSQFSGCASPWFKELYYAETWNSEPLCWEHPFNCIPQCFLPSHQVHTFSGSYLLEIEIIPFTETTDPSLWGLIQLVRTPFLRFIWW